LPVQLAVTVLFHIPSASKLRSAYPLDAFHSSIILGGVEHVFDGAGVHSLRPLQSHRHISQQPKVLNIGHTVAQPSHMLAALRPHFEPGSYDQLRKNCNSFTDCALFYLLGKRLDPHFRRVEKLAEAGQKTVHLMDALRVLGVRNYQENPRAKGFDVDDIVSTLAGGGHMRPVASF
jgi:hypothetical protein